MNKGKKLKKLSRTTNERKQLFNNLIKAVVKHQEITTTISKAKAVQPLLEKLVTVAKDKSLTAQRQLIKKIGDLPTVKRMQDVAQLFISRPGGYTRIVRLGQKSGDGSQVVKLAWVEKMPVVEQITPKNSEKKAVVQTKNESKTKPKTKPATKKAK